jgi:hypothetical protein
MPGAHVQVRAGLRAPSEHREVIGADPERPGLDLSILSILSLQGSSAKMAHASSLLRAGTTSTTCWPSTSPIGPPRAMLPSSLSRLVNATCSFQPDCSRRPRDGSQVGLRACPTRNSAPHEDRTSLARILADLGVTLGAARAWRPISLHVGAVEVVERPDARTVDDAQHCSEVLLDGLLVREATLDQQRRGIEQLIEIVDDASPAHARCAGPLAVLVVQQHRRRVVGHVGPESLGVGRSE